MTSAVRLRSTAAEWEERFEVLDELASVSAKPGSSRRAGYCVGGERLELAGPPDVASWLARPLAHLAVTDRERSALRIRLGSGAHPALEALWRAAGGSGEANRRPRVTIGDGRMVLGGVWPDAGMVGLLHRRKQRAVLWVRDVDEAHPSDAQTLLRGVVAWWLADGDSTVVHAAGVATGRGAVLLVGRGGSGKTTAALACLQAGFSFLGDDSVFCRASTEDAFSLSGCANVPRDEIGRLAYELCAVAGPLPSTEKVLLDLGAIAPELLTARAPLRAVVRLKLDPRSRGRARRIGPAEALAALAPSSVFNVPALDSRAFSVMAELVRRLPAYEVELPRDRARAPDLIRRVLAEGGAT